MTAPIAITLSPHLLAALPPGEPGAKPVPKAAALPGLRQRVLDQLESWKLLAQLPDVPETLDVQPPATRAWLEAAMDAPDARLLGLVIALGRGYGWTAANHPGATLVHWLALRHGLPAAFDALLQSSFWHRDSAKGRLMRHGLPAFDIQAQWLRGAPGEASWALRGHWMKAEPAVRAACMDRLRAAWDQIPDNNQRAVWTIVLPEAHEFAARLLDAAPQEHLDRGLPWLRWAARQPLDQVVNDLIRGGAADRPRLLALLLRQYGAELLPTLLALIQQYAKDPYVAWCLAAIDTPEATLALARISAGTSTCARALNWAANVRPEPVFLAVARVLDEGKLPKGGSARLTPIFKTLAGRLGERLPALLPELSPALRRMIAPVAQIVAPPATAPGEATARFAERNQWPAVLADPPWSRARAADQPAVPGLPVLDVPPQEDLDGQAPEHLLDEQGRPVPGQIAVAKFISWALHHPGMQAANLAPRYLSHSVVDEFIKYLPGWTLDALMRLDEQPERIPALIADWRRAQETVAPDKRWHSLYLASLVCWLLPSGAALAFWNDVVSAISRAHDGRELDSYAGGMVARFGLAALPGLIQALRVEGDTHFVAQYIGAVDIAPFMAQALARRPSRRAAARGWLQRFPLHAAAGLLPAALGEPDEGQREAHHWARAALRALVAMGQGQAIETIARRYPDPAVLTAAHALLAEDPLQDYPGRLSPRSKLPPWWQPVGWRRPRLRANGLPLPDEALHPLGLMLSFAPDRPQGYAGLDAVREACDPQSLADFAWDACEAWQAAGCGAAGNWALRALGWVGTDETARQLGALARRWGAPGAGGTATRIGWILEALTHIGSDVALLQLDTIARKSRLIPVREQAHQRLAEIGDARGLTAAELEDRLVPDLGLDARGDLLLDFGPRQFHVGFDETLQPFVRESVEGRPGPRLATAPRPRASDDAERAAEAVARFKGLKQDVALIATQQPQRLERAMCSGRSWPVADFRQFIAEHPLMRHLAKRLVWGVLIDSSLATVFRVSAEGEWVDENENIVGPAAVEAQDSGTDDPGARDAGNNANARIIIVHPLQLTATRITAFAQQFADYELIQPFEQLSRATDAPREAERASRTLTRWVGLTAHAGPLWGLESRGWARERGDSGTFYGALRSLPSGGRVSLSFKPGLPSSGAGEDQTLGELRCDRPFGELDPIDFSEMVRDVQALGAR